MKYGVMKEWGERIRAKRRKGGETILAKAERPIEGSLKVMEG
ncbi:MAG: hypothetical protein ACE5GD_07115 [Candidatus Geothermarchaeales archaeon]